MEGAEGKLEKLDLLRRFMKTSDYSNINKQEEEEEIELCLGLSLNGRFGVDPRINKRLKRSSSVANLEFAVVGGAVENGVFHRPRESEFGSHAPLWRTQSLPIETEEECPRRKALQSMRRMEARKKRMEKLKNSRALRNKETVFPIDVRNGKNGLVEGVNGESNGQRVDNSIFCRLENGDVMDSSQGSIGPPRSFSSGSSDLIQGSTPKLTAEAPPYGRQSHPPDEQEYAGRALDRNIKGSASVLLKNGKFDMPYVTTKETGPNGLKIEGFLYRYKKGEDVRIVCACHGKFLTPKEFVAHGGGGDVEQPSKHIVVNPFPLF